MKRLVTLSSLPLLAICPGAGALPWIGSVNESAALGNALHGWIEHLIKDPEFDSPIGADHFARLWDLEGDDARRYYFLASSFRPNVPAGALAEVPLALLADGSAVRLPGGGQGSYPDAPRNAVLAGSLDVVWGEPNPFVRLGFSNPFVETVFPSLKSAPATGWAHRRDSMAVCTDWKTGDPSNVAPAARNWQIKGAVLLAARWTGATKAIGGVCFVEPGPGRWEQHLFEDIDAIEREIRDLLHRVEEARLAVAAGEQPELVTGAHCEHCPARAACPAWVAPVRALMAPEAVDYLGSIVDDPRLLSSEQATAAAEILPTLRALVELCKVAAEEGALRFGPLTLKSGKVYGPREETREALGVRAAYEELEALVGPEKADGAFRVTKSGIKDALREAGASRGSYGRLMAKLEERGAITKRRLTVYSARHVAEPKALEAEAAEPAEGSAT